MTTIAQNITIKGIGLHTGAETTVKLLPSEKGRHFIRVDLPDRPIIPATVKKVAQTTLSTELEQDGGTVRTVEHLLAALVGLGVENVAIEIDGPEIPLLDGSAQPWVKAILDAGIHHQDFYHQKGKIELLSPLTVRENDAFVTAYPSSELRFTYGIDFEYGAIGNQWYSWSPERDNFAEEIAPARTFGLEDQIEKLREAGLIKGGSLENALVCGHQGWLNPPLRFTNEPVRHKLLDLLGDLSLLGTIPQAHYVAYKASHKLHIQLANQLNSHKKL